MKRSVFAVLVLAGCVMVSSVPAGQLAAPAAPSSRIQGVATGRRGAVASAEANATDIGIDVLKRGGNAVDAAVAVAFALGVTHPTAGNIGGGGFMVIRLPDGTSTAIDYREMAPGAASRDMYLDAAGTPTPDSRIGPRAAGIPGVVRGLEAAHKKFGKLPWRELVEPAVGAGPRRRRPRHVPRRRDGRGDADDGGLRRQGARETNAGAARRDGGDARAPSARPTARRTRAGRRGGSRISRRRSTAIAAGGADAFYRGPLARTLATRVSAMGGIWTEADLANYKAVEREPIRFTLPRPRHHHDAAAVGRRRHHAPDPRRVRRPCTSSASTGTRVDRDPPLRRGAAAHLRRQHAAPRRSRLREDPADDDPRQRLHPEAHGRHRSGQGDAVVTPIKVGRRVEPSISRRRTSPSSTARGMAVANTYTLNGGFGAKLQVPGTGVTLNNEMDDFTAKPGSPNMFGLVMGAQNAIQPGKRMLSSMTPTIVVEGRQAAGRRRLAGRADDHHDGGADRDAADRSPAPAGRRRRRRARASSVDARRDRLRGGAAGGDGRGAEGARPRDARPDADRRRQLHRGRSEDGRARSPSPT